jgi:integrase
MNDLMIQQSSPLASIPSERVTVAQAIAAHLAEPNPNTRRTYNGAMKAFAEFLGVADPVAAGVALLSLEHGQANLVALQYRTHMVSQLNLAGNTIDLRLNALRAATKLARRLGAINWTLDVEGIGAGAYRDTSGPGRDKIGQMMRATDKGTDVGKRDRAIISLIVALGLRRQSVADIDLEDIDLDSTPAKLQAKLKGRHDAEPFKIPGRAVGYLREWLEVRGAAPGPLFTRLDRARGDGDALQRLTGESIRRIVERAGERVGIDTHPHALRHTGATIVASESRNVMEVAAFLRHQSIANSKHYIDNLDDLGAQAAERAAGAIAE